MHRPGSNADAMTPLDFLCDFCLRPWADNGAMIEGHHGSLICTGCLTAAYPTVAGAGERSGEHDCTMCLQHKDGVHWRTETGTACRSCVEKAARMLERDPDSGWKRPEAPGTPSLREGSGGGERPGDAPGFHEEEPLAERGGTQK